MSALCQFFVLYFAMDCCFRFYVYTRFSSGLDGTTIHQELQNTHGDDVPSLRTIFCWLESINSETFEFRKQPQPERLISVATPGTIAKIKTLVDSDCRLSCREMAGKLKLDKSLVHKVLTGPLDLRNVSISKVVSH